VVDKKKCKWTNKSIKKFECEVKNHTTVVEVYSVVNGVAAVNIRRYDCLINKKFLNLD
jgi:hypothetical protein